MIFTTDKQTLDDLNIFGRKDAASVYGMYNRTHTRGGAALLTGFFNEPLSSADAIRARSAVIAHFATLGMAFPFRGTLFDEAEQYLSDTDQRTKLVHETETFGRKLAGMISVDTERDRILRGVEVVLEIARACEAFIRSSGWVPAPGAPNGPLPGSATAPVPGATATPQSPGGPPLFASETAGVMALLAGPIFAPLLDQSSAKLSVALAASCDTTFRFRHRDSVRQLLNYVYHIDVYLSVAKVAVERGFTFPTVLDPDAHTMVLKDLYHPGLQNPVPSAIRVTPDSNVIFLTGANMAGKSTFMKALGIAVYVAHAGFPVAASEMSFSVLDGLLTTINLPDNLGMGASHFYAEVLRVKKVALELNRGRKLLVIFDELFRGTNVKDAFDATVAVTAAFASQRDSAFVISTHIMEAGDILGKKCDNIRFHYLPTRMEGERPIYTYRLEKGITDDRHGMVIIRNAGILAILENGKA